MQRRTLDKTGDIFTLIGPESTFIGKFTGSDNYMVRGKVIGECDLKNTIIVGEGGHWEGSITAANVIVAGTIDGDIVARKKLELVATAVVKGNLAAPEIAVAEGAKLDGKLDMHAKTGVKHFHERRTNNNSKKPGEKKAK
ncbi:MAG TPA: polymer-forming cytoskeletal protein [Acidiferrobacteraceae bacterium]|nr:polymer-forming cytoskeletal protein [Acidiferrobacteraceae bacterium]